MIACATFTKAAETIQSSTTRLVNTLQRMRLFIARKDMDGAVKFANGVIESNPHEIVAKIIVARNLADVPDLKGPALDLAAKIAQAGYEGSGEAAKGFTALPATVKMIQGDKQKAVELQTKAIDELSDETPTATKQRYKATLDAYKAGKLQPSRAAG